MTSGADILSKLLSSQVKGDLLVLFHRNPGLVDTIDGVARRVGRTGDSIAQDVNDLVDLGVLSKNAIGNSEALLLNRQGDRDIQAAVASYLQGLKKDAEV